MSTPIVSLAEILQNEEIAPDIYKMELQAFEITQNAMPGQFLHIRRQAGHKPPVAVGGG